MSWDNNSLENWNFTCDWCGRHVVCSTSKDVCGKGHTNQNGRIGSWMLIRHLCQACGYENSKVLSDMRG